MQFADPICSIVEAFRLNEIDFLFQRTIEKGCLDIKLLYLPVSNSS
jgi:hypothetical protein